jgi:hypothetical protein
MASNTAIPSAYNGVGRQSIGCFEIIPTATPVLACTLSVNGTDAPFTSTEFGVMLQDPALVAIPLQANDTVPVNPESAFTSS